MDILHDDADLGVEYLAATAPGGPRRLVVAFSGIGHGFGGLQRREFVGTAAQGGLNAVAFVSDKKRSWYTTPGLVDRIAGLVTGLLDRLGLESCDTLGNSMGGYGAARLAAAMPVGAALCFSPQASMDPALIDEPRWAEHRPAIRLENHPALGSVLVPRTRYYFVFGAASRREVDHRNLIPDGPGRNFLMLPGGGHNIVRLLKEAGELAPLVTAMLAQDDVAVAASIARYEAALAAGRLTGGE